ncbi:hypothetical protein KUV65_17185 [Maritalea mobilis]|uniref:hypothetical protein n=1 Tax=Maritalea mobilis TaxID=483324 RepID=UPI001C98E105|nr:hypothetical protein [Maritalea mobilis]MBY6203108.1 hypothetical protein [Maritalea mobilis]
MIRGEEDIAFSSLKYHARLGFDRIIVLSHVEFSFLRQCVDVLRAQFRDTEFFLVEIPALEFSARKGNFINHTLSAFLRGGEENVIYCFDADEFLATGVFHSITDLVEAYQEFIGLSVTDPACPPSLATLPWKHLICNCVDNNFGASHKVSSDALSREFYEIEEDRGKGDKVIFLKRHNVWVHMGFHWVLDDVSREIYESIEKAELFVRQYNLGVYHFPLRTEAQLKLRIKTYQQSAVSSEKYNAIGEYLSASDGERALQQFFEYATASMPYFSSWTAAEEYFDGRLPLHRLAQFEPFLVSPRKFVGAVLSNPMNAGQT